MDLPENDILAGVESSSDPPTATATSPDVDGLLDQDQETLGERFAILEKRVQQQGDEIVCLKSALADVIRKLNQFQEAGRVMQNNVLPSKPAFKSTRRYGDKKNVHLSPVDTVHSSPSRSTTPPARTSPSHKANTASLKKWSSLSTTTELNDGSVKPFSSKEPVWNQGESHFFFLFYTFSQVKEK